MANLHAGLFGCRLLGGCPSFAHSAKRGLFRSNATCSLLLGLFFLRSRFGVHSSWSRALPSGPTCTSLFFPFVVTFASYATCLFFFVIDATFTIFPPPAFACSPAFTAAGNPTLTQNHGESLFVLLSYQEEFPGLGGNSFSNFKKFHYSHASSGLPVVCGRGSWCSYFSITFRTPATQTCPAKSPAVALDSPPSLPVRDQSLPTPGTRCDSTYPAPSSARHAAC